MRRGVKRKMEKADEPSTRLIDLFLAFARVGMLTFGGGVAMLPMLERECVQRFGWVNNDELTDYFAIGQCTPGIIAVNTATFVGSKQRGALGAAVATLGVISPSIVIILIIAAVLNGFADNPYVIHAFAGIRAAVCALMVNAVVRLCKSNVRAYGSYRYFARVSCARRGNIGHICRNVYGTGRKTMSIYFTLFWEFFKTGLFAIGGGMATLPFLSSMAERFPWLTQEQLANMIAVSESTPGPLGINCATYAGYNAAGVPGAIIASISEVLPSYIIILIISKMLRRFSQSKYVSFAFGGLRPAATGLIAAAAWGVVSIVLFNFSAFASGGIAAVFNIGAASVFALMMVLTNIKPLKKLHPLYFIAFAAVLGIVFEL